MKERDREILRGCGREKRGFVSFVRVSNPYPDLVAHLI